MMMTGERPTLAVLLESLLLSTLCTIFNFNFLCAFSVPTFNDLHHRLHRQSFTLFIIGSLAGKYSPASLPSRSSLLCILFHPSLHEYSQRVSLFIVDIF
jgi:hypothetical protein